MTERRFRKAWESHVSRVPKRLKVKRHQAIDPDSRASPPPAHSGLQIRCWRATRSEATNTCRYCLGLSLQILDELGDSNSLLFPRSPKSTPIARHWPRDP